MSSLLRSPTPLADAVSAGGASFFSAPGVHTTMSNDEILARSEGFLKSMSSIASSSDIAVDLFAHHGCMRPLSDIAATVASGSMSTAPVSLTVACGERPGFAMRGTHALATVQADRRGSGGPIVISIIIAVLLVAIVLCRR